MHTIHRRPTSRRLAVMLAALYFGAAAADSAYAQEADSPVRPEQWTVTPMLGFVIGGDIEGGGIGVGVAGGYNYNSRLRFEGEFMILPSVEQDVLVDIDSTIWTLTGNVLYHFVDGGPTAPYVAGGIGIGRGTTDLDEADPLLVQLGLDESSTELVFTIGGGVAHRLNERFSIRGDLRYSTGDDLVSDFFRVFAGLTIDVGPSVP